MELITLLNKDSQRIITDVVMHPMKVNTDESGVLVETLRRDWDDIIDNDHKFYMQYYSETAPGLARDEDVWHYHPTVQDDRFSVVKGAIVVAIADSRYDSPTRGQLNLFYINARENPYLLLIPRQTLHGFMVVSKGPAILINFPTGLYDLKEEGRVPYEEAQIKTDAGELFNWDLVRKDFA
jgi:dTDP-4-dehydrorhamnose 3,5-epimerase